MPHNSHCHDFPGSKADLLAQAGCTVLLLLMTAYRTMWTSSSEAPEAIFRALSSILSLPSP